MQKQLTIPQKLKYILLLSLLIGFICPGAVNAQMFSVGDAEERAPENLKNYTIFGIALETADFTFTGEGLEDRNRADFNSNIIRFRLINPGLNITVGIGGKFTGMDNTSYFNAGALLYNDLPIIVNRPRIRVGLPIQISTDMKQVQSNSGDREFQQSSFLFGTGTFAQIKMGSRVDFSIKATPNYGFSFSQGSLFGGSLFRIMGNTRFDIAEVFGQNALSIGYDYDYRVYDIEGNLDDYNYSSHSLTIGLGF